MASNSDVTSDKAKPLSYSSEKVCANKSTLANGTETLAIKPITDNNTQKKSQEELPMHFEDTESRKGRFSWKSIAGFHIPCIIRLIDGEHFKFVSTRMAETQLLCNYLNDLHSDIYKSCTLVNGHFITDAEAKLLNEINYDHTNCLYGKKYFLAGKDFITRLEDVHEFYTFLEICFRKLLSNIPPNDNEICGFVHMNLKFVIPYYTKDSQKYVPLFYFEGETENLTNLSIKLENWDLAYLKFCCKVQGIKNELFASESCTVIRLDDIKNCFPPDTNFREYWPDKVMDKLHPNNQKFTHVRPSDAWIRAPSEVVPAENTMPHTLTAPAPVIPQSMPMIMNTYQNRWTANQMCSTTSQSNISTNGMGPVVPPPPLAHAVSTSVIGPCLTTVYTPTIHGYFMSYSNQIGQLNGQCAFNNSLAHQQFQQQQIQHNQQQQPQQISILQTQQSHRDQLVCGHCTNTNQGNTIRNVRPTMSTTEIIDLTSPPSSPVASTVQDTFVPSNVGSEFSRIPDLMETPTTSSAYKIREIKLQGKTIYCINSKPYVYLDLMVILDDLIQLMMLPSCTVAKCAHILNNYLQTKIFWGNSEQLALLRDNGRIRSMCPKDTPMAMLKDIARVLPQLRALMLQDEETQHQYVDAPSKRPRNS